MFSNKSELYKSVESEVILDMHRESIVNLKINLKLRILCILSILIAIIVPWYQESGVNIYVYMVCSDQILPTNCTSFSTIRNNCSNYSNLCSKYNNAINGGFAMLAASIVCIMLQILSIFNVMAYINGKIKCQTTYCCQFSSAIYCAAFIIWNCLIRFDSAHMTAYYGLTASFTCLFFQIFLTIHFFSFKRNLIDYYASAPTVKSDQRSGSGSSIEQDQ